MALSVDDTFVKSMPCGAVESTRVRLAWREVHGMSPYVPIFNRDHFFNVCTDGQSHSGSWGVQPLFQ